MNSQSTDREGWQIKKLNKKTNQWCFEHHKFVSVSLTYPFTVLAISLVILIVTFDLDHHFKRKCEQQFFLRLPVRLFLSRQSGLSKPSLAKAWFSLKWK